MISIEYILIGVTVLILLSIFASKLSDKFGVPSRLIFLIIGMLAGSDGPGGIHFDDPYLAQFLGIVALSFILFSGGVDTRWQDVRPVLRTGLFLSTLGVLTTALITGWLATVVLNFSFYEGLLLGAIISSTDAAAVFSVLRARRVSLRGRLKPLLELESGSNDPMAVMLTLSFIQLVLNPDKPAYSLIPLILWQIAAGGIMGYLLGKGAVAAINNLKLDYEGLYPVFTLALVPFSYGVTAALGGNGFLAVYIVGLVMGNSSFIHKKSLGRFHDGFAWMMQISMFLTLGLLVFPKQLVPVIVPGLLISAFLMFIARPISTFLSSLYSGFSFREKIMVSWVGLRGAAPIILATFPLLAGVPKADMIFNVIFFIVISSALLQGTTIPAFARRLSVDAPLREKPPYTIEYESTEKAKFELIEFRVHEHSSITGKQVVDMDFPEGVLIILINRGEEFFVPGGSTVVNAGDMLMMMVSKENIDRVRSLVET